MPVEIQELPWCKPYINQSWRQTGQKFCRSKEAAGLPSRCWFVDKQREGTPCVNNAAGQGIQTQSKWWEFSQRRFMFWVVHWFSQYWKHTLGLVGCFAELGQWSLSLVANWRGIWLPHADGWLGLSSVWLYPLVCVFASLHATKFIEASQSCSWVCIT